MFLQTLLKPNQGVAQTVKCGSPLWERQHCVAHRANKQSLAPHSQTYLKSRPLSRVAMECAGVPTQGELWRPQLPQCLPRHPARACQTSCRADKIGQRWRMTSNRPPVQCRSQRHSAIEQCWRKAREAHGVCSEAYLEWACLQRHKSV